MKTPSPKAPAKTVKKAPVKAAAKATSKTPTKAPSKAEEAKMTLRDAGAIAREASAKAFEAGREGLEQAGTIAREGLEQAGTIARESIEQAARKGREVIATTREKSEAVIEETREKTMRAAAETNRLFYEHPITAVAAAAAAGAVLGIFLPRLALTGRVTKLAGQAVKAAVASETTQRLFSGARNAAKIAEDEAED